MGAKKPSPVADALEGLANVTIGTKRVKGDYAKLRAFLSIDKDALDDCLMEQPDAFEKVGQAYVYAVADRDALELDLEEARAELDQKFRLQAAKEASDAERAKEDKKKAVKVIRITDKAIDALIRDTPRVRQLSDHFLSACEEADRWKALKEAYLQRSHMLTALVDLRISDRYHHDAASGSGQNAYTRMASRERERR